MWQTHPQLLNCFFSFFFFSIRHNPIEIKSQNNGFLLRQKCCSKTNFNSTISHFMEKKYWRNPLIFILKVEDMDPETALCDEVFTSLVMADDWWIANRIILSYGNWCSWVIFTQQWFCWAPVCPSLWSVQITFLWKSAWFPVYLWLFLWMFPRAVFTFSVPSLCCPVVWQWGKCKCSSLDPFLWNSTSKYFYLLIVVFHSSHRKVNFIPSGY